MEATAQTHCTAFAGFRCIASGPLAQVVLRTKEVLDREERDAVLIFDDETSELIEVDWRGTATDVMRRLPGALNGTEPGPAVLPEQQPRGPGRPRLGVVAREVT